MTAPASAVYEISLADPAGPRARRTPGFLLAGLWKMARSSVEPDTMIISVMRIEDGTEVFRHIEDLADDEDHLLDDLKKDLASMTADEFTARWAS